jgi:hypothetical protein
MDDRLLSGRSDSKKKECRVMVCAETRSREKIDTVEFFLGVRGKTLFFFV